MNLTFRADLPPILITTEDVPAGIGRVLEQAQHPAVRQAAPDQLPLPYSSIRAGGETERATGEALHHREGAARFAKQPEHQAHRAPHFFVRIQDDTAFLVLAKADRKGETQFTFLSFVELAALEAGAQEMYFGGGHNALQS